MAEDNSREVFEAEIQRWRERFENREEDLKSELKNSSRK